MFVKDELTSYYSQTSPTIPPTILLPDQIKQEREIKLFQYKDLIK